MRVLVTGSSGFIGEAVVAALIARGDTVVAFDRAAPAAPAGRVPQVTGDIADAAAVRDAFAAHRPESVIHAAAVVGVLSSLDDPAGIARVNIQGALNVFEAMRRAGVARCIHVSSEEAYGPFRTDPVDESHALDPVTPYGICKAAVEQFGRACRQLHGLEVINLRASWVYGPGLPRDRIPKNLVEAALAGRELHLACGAETAIDHTWIDDVTRAILMALDHPRHRHDAYNIASGAAVTVAELVRLVRELVPGARLSVGPGALRHGDRIDLVQKGALDVSRAAAEFGWRPRFDIRAGLAAYVQALRAHKAAPPAA